MSPAARQKTFLEFDVTPEESVLNDPAAAASARKAAARQEIESSTVWVIDAHSLIYQVFFAVGEMTSPAGQPVNAVFGFLRDVLDIIEKKTPGYLICTFDRSEITFRNELFKEYKAHRDPMPDNLRSQIPLIQELLHALDIPVMDIANYEADDIMATVAREVEERGGRCFVVTSDKDCRQLITDRVKLFNIRKNQIYDETSLMNDWGIRPDQVIDFQAMVGDSVDNVPGIPSVGPKTARKFLEEFGSLEGLLSSVGRLTSAKQREKIEANADVARLSRDLVRLDDRVPIETDWETARLGNIDVQTALDLCDQLGFRSLAKRISELPIAQAPAEWETNYKTISDEAELKKLVEQLARQPRVAFDTETTSPNPRMAELVGFSLAWGPGDAAYIPVLSPAGQPHIEADKAMEIIRPLLENQNVEKIGQNLKYDIVVLRGLDVSLHGPLFDTMVADYLLDAGQRNHGIDDLARRYLNHKTIKIRDLIGTGRSQRQMNDVHIDLVTDYAAEDADVPFRLYQLLHDRLESAGLLELFRDVEMPLIQVLADMEYTGIRVDRDVLQRLSQEFSQEIDDLRKQIFELAGSEFNLDSPQQMAKVLFDDLNLPVTKKTATGRSTAVDVLETLAEDHELPRRIIEYRQFAKLRSTYTDALINLINPQTRRVHTSFMQDVAATGRLSSKDPNLQNIPIRTETGRQIRTAFVADPADWLLLSADYSQIELRMLAHFSQDEALLDAFRSGQDIHTAVAAQINEVPLKEVTSSMRRAAKTVNFGIIYGQTPFGLAKSIGISKDEAAEFIDAYFARYPGVATFSRDVLARANQEGVVTTILGRRRRIEGVRHPDKLGNTRFFNFAERTSINTVIQGSAADLIKLAMINVRERLAESSLPARLLLQIHDELVFEFDPARQAEFAMLVRDSMDSAAELRVPLHVDLEVGPSWGSTKPIDFRGKPD
ncbi:MAG: DNA polymerase I [Pirellulaceae bacterium]